MELSVRKTKTFRGMEGYGFNAELLVDGKPVAYAIDDGNGGCVHIDWYDLHHGKSGDRERVLAWLAKQSLVSLGLAKTEDEKDHGVSIAKLYAQPHARLEAHLGALVDRIEDAKRLARLRKTHVLFRDNGETYQIKLRPGESRELLERAVMLKHPAAQLL